MQRAGESDAEMAARLQREFDAENSRGRPSRSGAAPPKKKPVKRKSKATIEDEDGEPKKKRKGGGGGAFNKEMILR
jgi:upstream activation factor subunit UAF30